MKVTVVNPPAIRASINNPQRATIRTVGIGSSGSGGVSSLEQLTDVDATGAENNETLVYDETTGKYVVKTIPMVDGGSF